MTTSLHRETAKIYPFPVGGRAALGGRRDEAKIAANLSLRVSDAAYGGSWYHEEAIQEDQTRKR